MRSRFSPALLLCAVLALPAAAAPAKMPADDVVKGGHDHPLLSRFEGAKIVGYSFKEYDAMRLPAGKHLRVDKGVAVFENDLKLEGRYTRIAYNYPRERSALEVMRNYEAALRKAGLKTVFSCVKLECGRQFGEYWRGRMADHFVKGAYNEPFNYGRNDMRYLVAQGARADGSPVHVAVYVTAPVGDQNGGIYTAIVEGRPMETGKVTASLNAADMAKSIAAEGKVAIYGVYFDTDKADVKPDSQPALAEMAKLLLQDPKLKVYVVGHTDNQGALAHNVDLSQRRAESVVRTLAADYRIDAKRLSAKGVASYAPVASNDADAGREKNRRVELVKQ
jgi:OmpA-OmpF porin, OOP family